MVTTALNAPEELGLNATLSDSLCPAAIVIGRTGPASEKYLVETVALLTVTETGPEFVARTVKVLLLPAATLPNVKLALASERVLVCWPVPPALTPTQPTSPAVLATSNNTAATR